MRKKSHIALAKYIVESLNQQELIQHRKMFYIGSILPDCKPSFLTVKHEINGTIELVSNAIERLTSLDLSVDKNVKKFVRDLGQVLHYIADYFTFPHNSNYPGNLKDHCSYEEMLKRSFKEYIRSGEVFRQEHDIISIYTVEDIKSFILEKHKEYMEKLSWVERDVKSIAEVCRQVAVSIIHIAFSVQLQKTPEFGY